VIQITRVSGRNALTKVATDRVEVAVAAEQVAVAERAEQVAVAERAVLVVVAVAAELEELAAPGVQVEQVARVEQAARVEPVGSIANPISSSASVRDKPQASAFEATGLCGFGGRVPYVRRKFLGEVLVIHT